MTILIELPCWLTSLTLQLGLSFAHKTAIAIFVELKPSLDGGYQHDPVQVITAQRSTRMFCYRQELQNLHKSFRFAHG
ncbi:MAG: hypothetical protein KME12_16115 [Trichocoleus desertorum ATA4-8-CV12]|nr:hypothetical protein [Trichocoleus desertorum ATA4-8-CV12]